MKIIDRIHNPPIPSAAQELTVAADQMVEEGVDVVRLLLGQPGTGAPRGAIEAVTKIEKELTLGYTSALGIKPLRERLSKHYRDFYQLDISYERIIISIGASIALVVVLVECFARGAKIGLPYPAYPAQKNTMDILGYEPVGIYTKIENNFQLTLEDLENLPTKLDGLLISSPSNPTGAMIPPKEIEKIVNYCQKHNIILISDEIYHGVTYKDSPQAESALRFSNELIVINSFSKYYSMPGWRVGWMVVPEALVNRMGNAMRNLYLSPPAPSQHAALAAMDCREELEKNIENYARNRALLIAGMKKAGFTKFIEPQGAFYLYVDISHTGEKALDFCWRMLKEKAIAMMPGSSFDPERGDHYIRLSYAGSTADIQKAIERFCQ